MRALAFLLLLTTNACAEEPQLLTGDLVFQSSESAQSVAIREAQAHPASHMGIIVMEDGKPFVLEAVGPVKKTRLADFKRRSPSRQIAVMRDPRLDDAQRTALIEHARKDLGKPYDPYFTNDDANIYCSELVHRAYAKLGVPIGRVQKGSELNLHGPAARALLEKRWRKHPLCTGAHTVDDCARIVDEQDIITPASMMTDTRLVPVFGALDPSG